MGAANLMAKLQYGMSPVETEEDVSPIAEAYICHVSGAEFWGDPAGSTATTSTSSPTKTAMSTPRNATATKCPPNTITDNMRSVPPNS